jgi:hypothetical protein
MRILCTICFRKGSKGLQNKNIKYIFGKPLFKHTVDQAIKSKIFDNIIISSDYKNLHKYIKFSKNLIFLKRDKKLSNDRVGKLDVIKNAARHAEKIQKKKFDIFFDMDVTSPVRTIDDIKNALSYFIRGKYDNLITATLSKKNPYFNMVEIIKKKVGLSKKKKQNLLRRQDAPKVYSMNASMYIWKRNFFFKNKNIIGKKTGLYPMTSISSYDIDNELDFEINKLIIKKYAKILK